MGNPRKLGSPEGTSVRAFDYFTSTQVTTEQIAIAYPVRARALSMSNQIDLSLKCLLSTVTLNPGTITIRIKYGSAVLTLRNSALTLVGGLVNTPIIITASIANKDTVQNQYMTGEVWQMQQGISVGSLLGGANGIIMDAGDFSVDTTVDQVFIVSVQFSTVSPSTKLVVKSAEAVLA